MNQNGEHLMNICELNIFEINTKSYSLCMYCIFMIVKAKTFERSTNHIETKITRRRFMEDACILDGISLMNVCWVNQSAFYQVLNAAVMVCLKKMFNGEIIFHLKRRLKRLPYFKWKAWYKLLSSSGLKNYISTFPSSTIHPFEGHEILGTKHCIAVTLKKRNE